MLQIDSLSPHKYSGELFGVQYLYAQSGEELPSMMDKEVDEGFIEEQDEQEYPETIDATLSSDDDSEVCVHVQV